jgi:hypothetical protein
MTKSCKRCGIEKELAEYHIDSKMSDGHKNICRSCRSKKRITHITLNVDRKKFDKNLNASIYYSIKNNKSGSWERLFGYTLKDLKEHLEKQFVSPMDWSNFGSVWWIDKIIPRAVFKYVNVKNNEFHKCWCLKNLRPLLKNECKRKGDKVLWPLIEQYSLFGILPAGLIPMRGLDAGIKNLEFDDIVYRFVEKLENHKIFDKGIYLSIVSMSRNKNKVSILYHMIEKIKTFQDYDEDTEKVNFDYSNYLKMLKEE